MYEILLLGNSIEGFANQTTPRFIHIQRENGENDEITQFTQCGIKSFPFLVESQVEF